MLECLNAEHQAIWICVYDCVAELCNPKTKQMINEIQRWAFFFLGGMQMFHALNIYVYFTHGQWKQNEKWKKKKMTCVAESNEPTSNQQPVSKWSTNIRWIKTRSISNNKVWLWIRLRLSYFNITQLPHITFMLAQCVHLCGRFGQFRFDLN